jgi:adenylylsulfate kinase-like enzyme
MTGVVSAAGGADVASGVIWVCGLAGVGKTTLSRTLVSLLEGDGCDVVLIDGDRFRRTQMPQAGYTRDERLRVARGIHVHAWCCATVGSVCVVATISLFDEIHEANRAASDRFNLPLLVSQIDAPQHLRVVRRPEFHSGAGHVVGVDIAAEFPVNPDHHFVNMGSRDALSAQAQIIRCQWFEIIARRGTQRE